MAIPMATAGAGAGAATQTTDKYPSGSWTFGPIKIEWDIKDNDKLDVKVSVLGVNIDSLTGILAPNSATLSDQLNILGIVSGTLSLSVKYNQGPATDGLWIGGQVKAGHWESGQMNHRIIPW